MRAMSRCDRAPFLSFLALVLVACGGSPSPEAPKCPAVAPAPAPSATAIASAERPAPSPGPPVDSLERELIARIDARDGKAVFATFGANMQGALPEDKAVAWVNGIVAAKGRITRAERVPGKGNDFHGVYRLEAERGAWVLDLHIDHDGKVLGLKLTDPPAPDPEVAKSSIALGLPFRGQWSVFWGGATLETNQHVTHKSQRRAADLVVVDEGGKTHRGDGKKNDDFFAYGQDVLAVADGTVIAAIDGVPENAPGAMNPYFAFGNVIVLAHGAGLHSAYAHLQPGKLRVKLGTKVKRGAVLGACGNTGNSSEPHLHFQLQDGPLLESSWGVEPHFADVFVVRAGVQSRASDYTWLKGDLVGEPKKALASPSANPHFL